MTQTDPIPAPAPLAADPARCCCSFSPACGPALWYYASGVAEQHDRRLEGARGAGRARLHLRDADDRRLSVRHRSALRRCRRRIEVEPAAARAQGQGHAGLGPRLAADRADHRIRRAADDRRAGSVRDVSRPTGATRRPRCTACRPRRRASSIAIEQPVVDRAPAGENLFKADRLDLNGRMVSGTVQDNPVIEIVLKLVAASAPSWHPAAATPVDADITAVLRGLKDFSPKPWPAAFPRIAGGRRPHRNQERARAAGRHHRGRQWRARPVAARPARRPASL